MLETPQVGSGEAWRGDVDEEPQLSVLVDDTRLTGTPHFSQESILQFPRLYWAQRTAGAYEQG